MAVIVKTNRAKWAQAVRQASETATYALAEQMLQDSEKFVPYSGGSVQSAGGLRESGKVVKGESGTMYLVWDTVYALYQWFGIRKDGTHPVRNYTTPGTGKLWVEEAKKRYGSRWKDIINKEFSEALK